MPRNCKNSPDAFCYICRQFTLSGQRKKITPEISKIYKLYFGCLWEIKIKLGYHMWLVIVVAAYHEIGSTNEGLLFDMLYR